MIAAIFCCFFRLNILVSPFKNIGYPTPNERIGVTRMNYIAIYLACFFIFLSWLTYEQYKSKKQAQKESDEFWAREEEANHTRNKDISNLPYILVEESDLPIADTTDETILSYVEEIKQLIQNPMVDFSEYTNTDLKLAYGVGNFKTLSGYDETFQNFLMAMANLAKAYVKARLTDEAIATYELAIRLGSHRVSDYEELARLFLQKDKPEKLTELLTHVKNSDFPRKEVVTEALKKVYATYQ